MERKESTRSSETRKTTSSGACTISLSHVSGAGSGGSREYTTDFPFRTLCSYIVHIRACNQRVNLVPLSDFSLASCAR